MLFAFPFVCGAFDAEFCGPAPATPGGHMDALAGTCWIGTKPGIENGTSNIGGCAGVGCAERMVVVCCKVPGPAVPTPCGGPATAIVVGACCSCVCCTTGAVAICATAAIGCAVVGTVTVFDEHLSTGVTISGFPVACTTVGTTDDAWAAAATVAACTGTAYGAVGRMRRTSVGFGAFGAQTAAQGSNPTKRSPTGLASGVGWELIFIPFLQIELF